MTPARQRTFIIVLLVIGMGIVGFFGWRTLHVYKKFRGAPPPPIAMQGTDQAETDVELIRDWMTIPFIAKTYHVPPNILFDALEIPPNGNKEKSIKQLNREYYPKDNGAVITRIKAAILEYQSRELPGGKPDAPHPPIQPIGPIPP